MYLRDRIVIHVKGKALEKYCHIPPDNGPVHFKQCSLLIFHRRTTSENRKQMTLSRGHHHKKIGWWKRTKYSMGIVSNIVELV